MLVECKLKKFPILAFLWSSGKGRHSLHNDTLWEVPEEFSCNKYGNEDTLCAPSGVLNGEVPLYTSSGFSLRWMALPITNFVALHTEKVNAAHWKGYLSGQSWKYWSNHICKLAVAKIFLDGLACMKSKHVKPTCICTINGNEVQDRSSKSYLTRKFITWNILCYTKYSQFTVYESSYSASCSPEWVRMIP